MQLSAVKATFNSQRTKKPITITPTATTTTTTTTIYTAWGMHNGTTSDTGKMSNGLWCNAYDPSLLTTPFRVSSLACT